MDDRVSVVNFCEEVSSSSGPVVIILVYCTVSGEERLLRGLLPVAYPDLEEGGVDASWVNVFIYDIPYSTHSLCNR